MIMMRIKSNPYIRSEFLHDDLVIPMLSGQISLLRQFLEEVGEIDVKSEYTLEIKKKRLKRSLNANNYSWVLTDKLADKLGISKDECHRLMLARYGQTATDGEGNKVIFSARAEIPETELIKRLGYIAPIREGWVGEKRFIHYRALKGSSEFDSKEMSVFIDGIVSECKEQGIETATPDELEEMKQKWGIEE